MEVDFLYNYNPWWESGYKFDELKERIIVKRLIIEIENKSIIMITGLRRVGKSTAMKLIIKHLIEVVGIESKYILYVSLDNYIFDKFNLFEILEKYRQIHKLRTEEKVYLFFDEIIYKDAWQQQLKNVYDMYNYKIFASSSMSSKLRDEKAFLTGREKIFEMQPLDFEEYLQFKGIEVKKRDYALIDAYFEDYLRVGGIPEYVITGDVSYLNALIDDIIYKDIIAYNKLKDSKLVRDFFLLLMERAGKQLSLSKIKNILGDSVSIDTISRYINYFADTYLIYQVPYYGKTNEIIRNPKKLYAADIGIRNTYTGFRDKGAIFENYVFLKIRNMEPSYVLKDGIELDFITRNKKVIECKYGPNAEMNDNQKKLFNEIDAEKKYEINGIRDLLKFEEENVDSGNGLRYY